MDPYFGVFRLPMVTLGAPHKGGESVFDGLSKRTGRFLFLLKGAEFNQADGSGKLRLIERGFEAADGRCAPQRRGQLEGFFGKLQNAGNARPAAAYENAGAQVIQQASLG